MVTLEPFRHEKCTAFKERVEIANKVNEIVDYINDEVNPLVEQYDPIVEAVENHTEQIESLEDDFNTLNTSISDLEDTVDTIDNDIDSVRTTVNGIQSTINGIQGNVHSLMNDVDDIETNIEDLQNTTSQITSDIETLDETTVKKTGDESISGNKTFTDTVYADDVNTKAMTVHGNTQMLMGTIVLSPNSQGSQIQFKNITNKSISIIQGVDSDNKCYLREYPNTYYPKDSNNNPIAPPSDVIMTSGLIGVDPRITGKATIDYVDEKINDVKNPVWVLCNDVSSVRQHIDPYYIFTKDVKIVFHLFYDFQRPEVMNISSGRLIYTVYFKKGDMFYYLDKILPVLNGEYYPDDGYRNSVYFGITFNTLFYDSPNDIVYNAFTEYTDLNYSETKHHGTFTLHRQNENLNYGTDSFVNVYIKDGE